MSEKQPRRRRSVRFGLRKLILCTTAVAILLSWMRTWEYETAGFGIVLGGLTIMGVLRFLFEPRRARMLWILVVAIAGVVVAIDGALAVAESHKLSHGDTMFIVILLSFCALVLGGGFAGMIYTLTDVACRMVDWLDGRMQSGDRS